MLMNACSDTGSKATGMATELTDNIQLCLGAWFAREKRDLPWRGMRDPYAIWISEVMLQQTQVKTVSTYFTRFLRRFPDVNHLARADLQEVLKQWEGLGYYTRARNLHQSAAIIANQMGGRIPEDWNVFRGLPGVGDYIAAAVMSIAFGKPFAVVDGNVKRVLSRLFGMDDPVNQAASKKNFQHTADELLDRNHPGDHNQALMELGALICTPRNPQCRRCPINHNCRALKEDSVDRYPRRVPRVRTPQQHLVVCLVRKNGRFLIVKRPAEGLLGGMWELPGGPLRPDEESAAACSRLMGQTVGLKITGSESIAVVRHAYSHFRIIMEVFVCDWLQGRVRCHGPADFQWIEPNQIGHFPIHRAVLKAWPTIREHV